MNRRIFSANTHDWDELSTLLQDTGNIYFEYRCGDDVLRVCINIDFYSAFDNVDLTDKGLISVTEMGSFSFPISKFKNIAAPNAMSGLDCDINQGETVAQLIRALGARLG